jgi:hypothetical protein
LPSQHQRIAGLGCLVAAALLAAPVHADERTITCESRNYRYNYCRADTDRRVTLVRQKSSTRCRMWDNWGYDTRGVWVDRGCAAEFRVGRGGGGSGAAIAGAAIAGVAIAAAIAANKDHHDDTVPSWAVGTFRGYDEVERTDVELTVYPGGSVSGFARGSSFSGRWDGKRLQAGRHQFKVERSGNGFVATDESGRGNRIYFRRSDEAYGY